jgi:CTP synthase
MPDQRDMEEKGGTMRLGLYPARLAPGTKVHRAYGSELIYERHRHRFEVSNRYREALEAAGMILSGQSPDGRLVEIVELRDHPWYVASQFHPEFKSRPDRPHPLFAGFITAAIERAHPSSAGGASAGLAQAPVQVHVDGGAGRGGRMPVPPAEVAEGT